MKNLLLVLSLNFAFQAIYSQANSVTEEIVQQESLFLQAMQEKILGNTDKAIKLFERVVKEQPENDAAFYQLSKLFATLDKEDKSFESVQKAASINPSNLYYQRILADHYESQKVYASAAKIYQKMYEAGNTEYSLLDKWAYNCARSNDLEQALKVLDITENKYGFSSQLARKQYDVFVLQYKFKKAESILNKLLDLDDQNTNSLYLLAMHYSQTDKEDKSKEYFARILEIDPNDSKANIALANNFKQQGQDQKFLNSISTIIENPKVALDLKIKEIIPYVEKLEKDPNPELEESLLKIASKLHEIHPNEAKVFALSGDIHYHSQQIDESIENYQKSVELRPDIWSVWEHLLYLQAEYDRESELIKLTNNAKDYFPNQALVYYMAGIAHGKLGNYEEAISELDDASLMVGNNAQLSIDIFALKGTMLSRINKLDEAEKWLNEALKLNSDHLPAISTLSQTMMSNNKDLASVEKLINHGLSLNADYTPLLASKGKLFFLQNNFNSAKEWLIKALSSIGNSDTALLEVLGDTYFQLNQIDQAVIHWQKALDLNSPNQKMLQKKINSKSLIK